MVLIKKDFNLVHLGKDNGEFAHASYSVLLWFHRFRKYKSICRWERHLNGCYIIKLYKIFALNAFFYRFCLYHFWNVEIS